MAPFGLPTLKELGERHSYNLDNDPVYAHWSSAGFMIAVGMGFALARGLVVAATQPAPHRWQAFAFAARGVAPLYVVPFVLGAQYDCYRVAHERRHRSIDHGGGLDVTTGAADLG